MLNATILKLNKLCVCVLSKSQSQTDCLQVCRTYKLTDLERVNVVYTFEVNIAKKSIHLLND